MISALRARDADRLVAHRDRALAVQRDILTQAA
jgi:hypothetical protein